LNAGNYLARLGGGSVSISIALTYAQKVPNLSMRVSDSSTNIAAGLDSLRSIYSNISSITPSNLSQPISLTSDQYDQYSDLIAKFSSFSAISLTGITSITDALSYASNANVSSVALADATSVPIYIPYNVYNSTVFAVKIYPGLPDKVFDSASPPNLVTGLVVSGVPNGTDLTVDSKVGAQSH
jgi:hypothetical protein